MSLVWSMIILFVFMLMAALGPRGFMISIIIHIILAVILVFVLFVSSVLFVL